MIEAYDSAGGERGGQQIVRGAQFATAILFFAFLLNYADRALPSLFMEPLKASFHASDTQVALLIGFSFAVSVSIFAVPLSWLADRYHRPKLIAGGIAVWCAATIGCALASDFWLLFALRMGVGLGEAVLSPAAYSLIADLYPSARVSRPLAVLVLGRLLGTVLALDGGGWLYALLNDGAERGWRGTMIIFGGMGLCLVPLAWFMPEPRSGRARRAKAEDVRDLGLWSLLRGSSGFFLPFAVSMSFAAMFDAGFQAWLSPLFARSYHWSIATIGQVTGTAALLSGLIGTALGAWLVNRVGLVNRNAAMTTLSLFMAAMMPSAIAMPWSTSGMAAGLLVFAIQLPGAAATAIAPLIFVMAAPPHLRARLFAVLGLCFGLFGWALGALVYAMFTQYVVGDPDKLYVSMSIVSGLLTATSTAFAILAARAMPALQARLASVTGD